MAWRWIPLLVPLWLLACGGGWLGFMVAMPGTAYEGPLAPLDADDLVLRQELERHVDVLSRQIGSRSLTDENDGLDPAERYMFDVFGAYALHPQREEYTYSGVTVANIVAERRGTTHQEELVVIGAHYDTVDRAPGADDNASGCAALLELGRLLSVGRPHRTIRFVAFVNEEPSYFQTERMGSLVHAQRAHERGDQIVAMLSLDAIGFYSDQPGSQKYPPPFSWFYPDRGNFIAFAGDISSRPLVRDVVGLFREHVLFPAQGVAAPGFIPGIGWSDHWSFWQYNYPAIIVTDTAPFRNPNYHTENDRPETLDYDRMTRVVRGLADVIRELANR